MYEFGVAKKGDIRSTINCRFVYVICLMVAVSKLYVRGKLPSIYHHHEVYVTY